MFPLLEVVQACRSVLLATGTAARISLRGKGVPKGVNLHTESSYKLSLELGVPVLFQVGIGISKWPQS